mmetsp:Transcript_38949/g.76564  ORF Transcript_38949/g.76564 Transcript_38949/m.76564 type:complete len:132 (+) Transcript_38949:479-874(+)
MERQSIHTERTPLPLLSRFMPIYLLCSVCLSVCLSISPAVCMFFYLSTCSVALRSRLIPLSCTQHFTDGKESDEHAHTYMHAHTHTHTDRRPQIMSSVNDPDRRYVQRDAFHDSAAGRITMLTSSKCMEEE